MAHTELEDVELEEDESEEAQIPVGPSSGQKLQLEYKEIKPLKQNLNCGFCGKSFSEVPKKGYLYPHTKMEDETDGRNACEICHPIELAAAIEAGLILPIIKIALTKKQVKARAEEQAEPPKKRRGRPRKNPLPAEVSDAPKRSRGRPRKIQPVV